VCLCPKHWSVWGDTTHSARHPPLETPFHSPPPARWEPLVRRRSGRALHCLQSPPPPGSPPPTHGGVALFILRTCPFLARRCVASHAAQDGDGAAGKDDDRKVAAAAAVAAPAPAPAAAGVDSARVPHLPGHLLLCCGVVWSCPMAPRAVLVCCGRPGRHLLCCGVVWSRHMAPLAALRCAVVCCGVVTRVHAACPVWVAMVTGSEGW
jgi:hypothetical protein